MGSENKNFQFLFLAGGYLGGTLGVTEGGCVTYHLLVQYNEVQLCSRVQVRPAVGWFPKNRYSWKTMKIKKKVLKNKYIWNNTWNMCHFTCDTLGWIHSLKSTVKEGILSHWINYEAVFRTTLSSEWYVNNIELKIYVSNRSNNISVF